MFWISLLSVFLIFLVFVLVMGLTGMWNGFFSDVCGFLLFFFFWKWFDFESKFMSKGDSSEMLNVVLMLDLFSSFSLYVLLLIFLSIWKGSFFLGCSLDYRRAGNFFFFIYIYLNLIIQFKDELFMVFVGFGSMFFIFFFFVLLDIFMEFFYYFSFFLII